MWGSSATVSMARGLAVSGCYLSVYLIGKTVCYGLMCRGVGRRLRALGASVPELTFGRIPGYARTGDAK